MSKMSIVKIYKKTVKWFSDLFKQKCPNCKSVDLVEVKKDFLKRITGIESYYTNEDRRYGNYGWRQSEKVV